MGNLSPKTGYLAASALLGYPYLRGSARAAAAQAPFQEKKEKKERKEGKGPPPPMAIPAPFTPQPPRRSLVGLKEGWLMITIRSAMLFPLPPF